MKFLACCVLPDKKLYGNCLCWLNIPYWKFFHPALKNSLQWNFPLYWIYVLPFRIFEQLALALKNRVCPEKQSCPEIFHCSEIFFIIQDFWATCACPENRVCPENFKDKGAAAPHDPPPRTPMVATVNENFTSQH